MKREKTRLHTIGVVASMFSVHPQTLRLYEREGRTSPQEAGAEQDTTRRRTYKG
ncbi:MAG: MerR family DNA-binding transcriptional regulator [Aquificaceae bacterium]